MMVNVGFEIFKDARLTAATRVDLAVWTKFNTVDGAMMALTHVFLLPVYIMYPDPFIVETPGDEGILSYGIDRCG